MTKSTVVEKIFLSVLVNNEAGVLTRVTGLFSRKGFNIDSLSVGETEDKKVSRITITLMGDGYVKQQVIMQLEKLRDVISVQLMDANKIVVRELMLIKIKVDKTERGARNEIMEVINVFHGKVLDMTTEYITVEITGESGKLDAFIEYVQSYTVSELCRTGATAMGRGAYVM